ncbi:Methyl-accepting chemotaxis protein [Clostridium cavendishii DSM 21758]|uniref:Methyl-accepting chemotaxis protein n=1 Tax=Clostridium cavendishii DSM 21758 TaxID=1121302 RepID=A0A1M6PIY8_9CLOT|nr:heme NO-binding domain-containing protein [Clostridium cavendishii]SHK07925.1 Methyl-accepting chemotaxis protein [Clostridium cavendishii DSM 21758]
MKGTVVSTWIKTCRKLYGDDIVNNSMEIVRWDKNRVFTPLENVEDKEIKEVLENIAKGAKITPDNLWLILGENNIVTFFNDYPAFFKRSNLYSFLKAMNDVHAVVMKKISGAKPPKFTLELVSKNECIFTYNSSRGMFQYFIGLLRGSAKHFKENIDIQEISRTSDSLAVKLKFDYEIINKKKFVLNNILSFGVIKNIGIKAFIPSLAVGAIISVFTGNFVTSMISSGVTALTSCIMINLLLNPKKEIIEEIKVMQNRKHSNTQIYTNDFLEDIFNEVIGLEESWAKDLTSFSSITDELRVFSNNMFKLTEEMKETTEEISGFSEAVSQMAVRQEENTETLIDQINRNIDGINNVVNLEDENKKELEGAIEKINTSYIKVDNASENIKETLASFMTVKEDGRKLQVKAQDITKIVSIVSGISEQTNLLALNASIEAARAGEQGRGFAVVAESIRKLAEQSKDAVSNINSNLIEFVTEINGLVSNIDEQYGILENETKGLKDVRDTSYDATKSIKSVASDINEAIMYLNKEVQAIQDLFKNIDSLAAIAAENSSAAQTVSASIDDYSNEIVNILDNIQKVRIVIANFKDEIEQYSI